MGPALRAMVQSTRPHSLQMPKSITTTAEGTGNQPLALLLQPLTTFHAHPAPRQHQLGTKTVILGQNPETWFCFGSAGCPARPGESSHPQVQHCSTLGRATRSPGCLPG